MGGFVLQKGQGEPEGVPGKLAAVLRRARGLSRLGARPGDRARLFGATFYLLASAKSPRRGKDRLTVTISAFGRDGTVTLSDYSQLVVLEAIFVDGDYALELAHEPRTIVDLGSNVGLSILYFKLRFPRARVLGIEPDPAAFALLERNTRQFDDVTVRHAAVGTAPGSATFWSAPGAVASSLYRTHDAQQPVEVEVQTLEQLAADVPTIDLLKLVVEGSEFAALESIDDLSRVGAVTGEIVLAEGEDERLRRVLDGFEVDLFEDKGDGFWQFHALRP